MTSKSVLEARREKRATFLPTKYTHVGHVGIHVVADRESAGFLRHAYLPPSVLLMYMHTS